MEEIQFHYPTVWLEQERFLRGLPFQTCVLLWDAANLGVLLLSKACSISRYTFYIRRGMGTLCRILAVSTLQFCLVHWKFDMIYEIFSIFSLSLFVIEHKWFLNGRTNQHCVCVLWDCPPMWDISQIITISQIREKETHFYDPMKILGFFFDVN